MKSPLKQILFIGLVVAQLAALGWMVNNRNQLINTGEKIRLECEPVDPRSLLSGDYVVLSYKISQFQEKELEELVEGEETFRRNGPFWVVLQKNPEGEFYDALRILGEPETRKKGEIVLRGTVERYRPGSLLRVRYGLEQYFVPQYEGKKIEGQLSDASVEVAVNEKGDGAVTRIFIAGKEVEFH